MAYEDGNSGAEGRRVRICPYDEAIAAISVPFLAGTEASHMEEIRLATIAAANELSAAMPAQVQR